MSEDHFPQEHSPEEEKDQVQLGNLPSPSFKAAKTLDNPFSVGGSSLPEGGQTQRKAPRSKLQSITEHRSSPQLTTSIAQAALRQYIQDAKEESLSANRGTGVLLQSANQPQPFPVAGSQAEDSMFGEHRTHKTHSQSIASALSRNVLRKRGVLAPMSEMESNEGKSHQRQAMLDFAEEFAYSNEAELDNIRKGNFIERTFGFKKQPTQRKRESLVHKYSIASGSDMKQGLIDRSQEKSVEKSQEMGRATNATAAFGIQKIAPQATNPLQESEPMVNRESGFEKLSKNPIGKSSSLLVPNQEDDFSQFRIGLDSKAHEDRSHQHSHLSINTSHLQNPIEAKEGSIQKVGSLFVHSSPPEQEGDPEPANQSLTVRSTLKNFMNISWPLLIEVLESERNYELTQLLESKMTTIKVIELKDNNGLNLLHHAVLKGMEGKTKILIDFAKSQRATDQEIASWASEKTMDEGWTPLHYASFQGNCDAIHHLVAAGADIHSLNNNGLNMLHVAAQGDVAQPLYIFYELGLDINARDNRGSTPLHWACYSWSEVAISFLLAWKPDLNVQDNDGLTPLHLAVRSVDAVESCRPVRALLIKGARKDIKDAKGKEAADYIESVGSPDLAIELTGLLKPPKMKCFILGSSPPVKKVERSYWTVIFYYIIFCLVMSLKALEVYTRDTHQWLTIASISCDSLTLLLHLVLACTNGGKLQNKSIEFLKLLQLFDSTSLCPECQVIRTSRSRHCIICHQCIDRYDHHCPWINNCVGVRNHNVFLFYIICQLGSLLLSLLQCVLLLILYEQDKETFEQVGPGADWLAQTFGDWNKIVFLASQIIIILVCFVFVFPMIKLLLVQLANLAHGKTTNERFSRAFNRDPEDESSFSDNDTGYVSTGQHHPGEDSEISQDLQPKRWATPSAYRKKKKRTFCAPLGNLLAMCCSRETGYCGHPMTQESLYREKLRRAQMYREENLIGDWKGS